MSVDPQSSQWNRREFLQRLGATAALAPFALNAARGQGLTPATSSSAVPIGAASRRPDILVLMTDQWNPHDLGYEGDPDVHTPNLDALAKESLRFENCYTTSPVCMPSRTCLVSGLYCHNTGLWGNAQSFYITPSLTPLFSDMKEAGYTTSQIGKMHWWTGSSYKREFDSIDKYLHAMGIDHPLEIPEPFAVRGDTGVYQEYLKSLGKFQEYVADMNDRLQHDQYVPRPSVVTADQHNDWFVGERAIDFLHQHPKDQPYFLVTSYPGPHPPLDAMGRYATMYDPSHLTLRKNVRPTDTQEHYTLAQLRAMRANYLGKMTLIDDSIGRVIAAVKERGNWDNTIVLFISDHGEMMGAQGRMAKSVFWDDSARVPFMVRIPGMASAGQKTDALVQLNDVYATAVELAGGKQSPGNYSRSLVPILTGQKRTVRDMVFSEISHRADLQYMVRDNRYKWFNFDNKEFLYDMVNDPFEMNNLAATTGDKVAELKSQRNNLLATAQINYSANYRSLSNRAKAGLVQ